MLYISVSIYKDTRFGEELDMYGQSAAAKSSSAKPAVPILNLEKPKWLLTFRYH